MKTEQFQTLLLKSAVSMVSCDGQVETSEIEEISKIAENEIYFMGFEYSKLLNEQLDYIKNKGKTAINEFLADLSTSELNENQELILIEVLIKALESDNKVEKSEIKFLQLVKSKLKITEETLITKFPKHFNYLLDFNGFGLNSEFDEEFELDLNI